MSDEKFWSIVWGMIVIGIVAIIASFLLHSYFAGLTVERMVKNGADPITAYCAVLGVGQSNAAVCALRATK